jgi:hypothetical protein
MRDRSSASFLLLLLLGVAFEVYSVHARLPFLGKKKDCYTPLVFFTVPKGLIAENDALEKEVRQLEKELGVRVERLDILRNPAAEATMAILTSKAPPFLYHRESCQTIHLPPTMGGGGGESSRNSAIPVHIDRDRLRTWAMGRYLAPQKMASTKVKAPQVIAQDSSAMDQDELLEDAQLTDLQRAGKEAIRKRTEDRANKAKDKK